MIKKTVLLVISLWLTACAQPSQIIVAEKSQETIITAAVPAAPALAPAPAPAPAPTPAPAINITTADTAPATEENLWDRFRNTMDLTKIDHPRIDQYIDSFSNKPRYINLLSERAQPFLFYLMEETETRGLPAELLMVPMIESNFRPEAVSPGKAAGLWQITKGTASNLGLTRNQWYDGRHDVIASTDAALDYLSYLNKMFDGDWLLTLAAYNCGEGTVQKAIRRNRAAGKNTDYWHLQLPSITRAYVPKILALSRIVAEPDQYGMNLPPIDDEPALQKVVVGPKVQLRVAAANAGLDMNEIRFYNPAFKSDNPPSGQDIVLLLPPADALALQQAQHSLGDTRIAQQQRRRLSAENTSEGTAKTVNYAVQRGDSLTDISLKFQVSIADLRKWNDIPAWVQDLPPGKLLIVYLDDSVKGLQG